MATAKHEEFTKKEQDIALMAKALSHPARIQILKILAKQNECICGEIVEILPLAQSTVSQHLKALQEAGLIQGTIDGPRSCYCINPKGLQKAASLLGELFELITSLQAKNKCC